MIANECCILERVCKDAGHTPLDTRHLAHATQARQIFQACGATQHPCSRDHGRGNAGTRLKKLWRRNRCGRCPPAWSECPDGGPCKCWLQKKR